MMNDSKGTRRTLCQVAHIGIRVAPWLGGSRTEAVKVRCSACPASCIYGLISENVHAEAQVLPT
jgi:hypothetical protein